jgi:hypothetical protein
MRQEQRRQERSGRPFLLVRVTAPALFEGRRGNPSAKRILRVLASAARETDTIGWIETGKVLGVLCTELGDYSEVSAGEAILAKIGKIAKKSLGQDSSSPARGVSHALDLSLEIYSSPVLTSIEAQGRRAQLVS